jgi:hypothetical protein
MMRNHGGGRSGWAPLWMIVVIGYSWLATGLRPFTIPIDVAVGLPAVLLLGWSWHRSRLGRLPPDQRPRPPRSSVIVWAVLVAALAAWELAAYQASPRQDHPTLSSIFDDINSAHPARAVVFALWLGVGLHLFGRRASQEGSRA